MALRSCIEPTTWSLERLVCPIGIRGIGGKEPAVIAASVAAQLLIALEAAAAARSTLVFEGVA